MPVDLFAGIPVADYERAVAWYERLLGSGPSFLPNDTEAVWEVAEHRFALTPGRYVGATVEDDNDEPFEDRFPALSAKLAEQFEASRAIMKRVEGALAGVARDV